MEREIAKRIIENYLSRQDFLELDEEEIEIMTENLEREIMQLDKDSLIYNYLINI